jgi:adenylosuccinate synthase
LRPGIVSVIATGVVINPQSLLAEIDQLRSRNITVGENLLISDRAPVIFPYHIVEEAVLEDSRGENAIGTTRRGIGTCYRDKAGRSHAIRVGDLYHVDSFKARLKEIVAQKNTLLTAFSPASCEPGFEPLDASRIESEYLGYARKLEPHVTDTTSFLHEALAAGKRLLFEGAQGSLLDLDHGTFPFVTSSSSSGCGIHSGSGVPERNISRMIGVVKAYTTRVGGGPFPTELKDAIGQHIRDVGREYGTVTGRPRRCGWFDAVAAGYGARISGVDCVALMLLDVLSQLDPINICTAYEIDGERTAVFPSHVEDLARAQPVYRSLPGWKSEISNIRRMADFPKQARAYLDTLSELIGKPIEIVSVGPDREQTIYCDSYASIPDDSPT